MIFDNTNLGLYTALTSALLYPGEEPARTSGNWLCEFDRHIVQPGARWVRDSFGLLLRLLRMFSALLFSRDRSFSPSRKQMDLELPASDAGQADPFVSEEVGGSLSAKDFTCVCPASRPRMLRLSRNHPGQMTLPLKDLYIVRPAKPTSVRSRYVRSPKSYPLVAETPAVYYVLSGVDAGHRIPAGRSPQVTHHRIYR